VASSRKIGITALFLWTIIVTVLRALRMPNDFAEAQWLLDYRFGFVKRGLVGTILSLATGLASHPATAHLIAVLATLAFSLFCLTMIVLSIRIVRLADWSAEAALAALVFVSSPFVIMSAHLNGYFDSIIIVLGVLSIALLLKGRLWPAVILQVAAVLVHETSILLVFPAFCLAGLLRNSRRTESGVSYASILPFAVPLLIFIVLSAGQGVLVTKEFASLYGARLSHFPFVQDDRSTLAPLWLSTPLFESFLTQKSQLVDRLTLTYLYCLVLPATLAILFYIVNAYRIIDVSIESIVLVGVCLVPQLMHLVAWDTPRIWTYSILCAFLALWVYAEHIKASRGDSANTLLFLFALLVNVLILTPLLDNRIERFGLGARLLLYTPMFAGALLLVLETGGVSLRDRLAVQGAAIGGLPGRARRDTMAVRPAPRADSEKPERP
jgi:hypothetical protein